MRHLLELHEFLFLEGNVAKIGLESPPKDVVVKKDKLTGLPTVDKSKVPIIDQLKVLAKELYQTSIEAGRSQSLMMDKITKLQQMGADEGVMGQMQQMMQDQMMAIQMKQMNLEMHMQMIAGNNMAMAQKAQQLSSESKFLADRQNNIWFKKRAKKIEADAMKSIKQRQKEEAARKEQHGHEQGGHEQGGHEQGGHEQGGHEQQ